MRSIDTEHGGTQATAIIQRDNESIRVFIFQTVYEVNFGSDRPLASGRGVRHTLDDVLCGTDIVRQLGHFPAAFRMHNNRDPRVALAYLRHMLGKKPLM